MCSSRTVLSTSCLEMMTKRSSRQSDAIYESLRLGPDSIFAEAINTLLLSCVSMSQRHSTL